MSWWSSCKCNHSSRLSALGWSPWTFHEVATILKDTNEDLMNVPIQSSILKRTSSRIKSIQHCSNFVFSWLYLLFLVGCLFFFFHSLNNSDLILWCQQPVFYWNNRFHFCSTSFDVPSIALRHWQWHILTYFVLINKFVPLDPRIWGILLTS